MVQGAQKTLPLVVMASMASMLCCAAAGAGGPPVWTSPAGVWAFTGGAAHHPSTTRRPLPEIAAARWTRAYDDESNYIRWVWEASPVVTPDLVIAMGFVSLPSQPPNRPRVYAFERDTGAISWYENLPTITPGQFFLGSQSSLCLDAEHNAVIAVVGRKIVCLDLAEGEERWITTLPFNIVNATPVITDDLGKRDRLFITDSDFAQGAGALYCINVDAFDTGCNPFQPGDIVWTAPLSGTSGNTPAYLPRRKGGCDVLYVASAGSYSLSPGAIFAFPVGMDTAPSPTWVTTHAQPTGFFGGVSIVPTGHSGGTELVAASYAFAGGIFAGELVRVRAHDGVVLGAAKTNRSSAMPVMLPEGLIASCGGLQSLCDDPNPVDTVPSLSLHNALLMDAPGSPTTAAMHWDSAVATWVDLDFDGTIECGEYFNLGGYTQQPLVSLWKGKRTMAVGAFAIGYQPAAPDYLTVCDVKLAPTNPAFVKELVAGAGGSVSIAGANLYSVGTDGLCAFGPEPSRFDIDQDKHINPGDLAKWESGSGSRDVNDDGSITTGDRDALTTLLRANEVEDMLEGRR